MKVDHRHLSQHLRRNDAAIRNDDTQLGASVGPAEGWASAGAVASARICPVRGSMTTTLPLSACALATCSEIASCATYWMSRSMVRRMVVPASASVRELAPVGIAPPPGPRS